MISGGEGAAGPARTQACATAKAGAAHCLQRVASVTRRLRNSTSCCCSHRSEAAAAAAAACAAPSCPVSQQTPLPPLLAGAPSDQLRYHGRRRQPGQLLSCCARRPAALHWRGAGAHVSAWAQAAWGCNPAALRLACVPHPCRSAVHACLSNTRSPVLPSTAAAWSSCRRRERC